MPPLNKVDKYEDIWIKSGRPVSEVEESVGSRTMRKGLKDKRSEKAPKSLRREMEKKRRIDVEE